MAKEGLGTKRVCPETGRKFYDLDKDPIISPYTGTEYPLSFFLEAAPSKVTKVTEKEAEEEVKPTEESEEDEEDDDTVQLVSLEDADDAGSDNDGIKTSDDAEDEVPENGETFCAARAV